MDSTLVYYVIFFIVILYFALSINFAVNFTSSFRHKNRLADAGPLVSILFMMKPIVYFIVSLAVIHILNGNVLGRNSKIFMFLILISTIMFLNSSMQFIFIILVAIVLWAPKLLIVNFKELNFKALFLVIVLAPLVCIFVIFIGIGNKVGYDYLLSNEGLSFLMGFGDLLFPRMSTSLFSSVVIFEKALNGTFFGNDVISGIEATLSNRFALINSSGTFDPSLIDTVNRLNYLEVFSNHAERAGASPGIIASSFFTPLFPFSFFIVPLYVAFIFRSLRYHMSKQAKFSLLSFLALPYLIINLFESPLNIFYIFDPILILFLNVCFFGRFVNINAVFKK
ncbi:hypothetical protein [Pseudoalteromonas sp. BSi20439]|uniref:hypothetical protein n=1 Tax=Pseudoalteromonas sp. BSi20439 TaxID=420915 RepID=UPI001110E22A|nr:hypothetical protein [Pseudoalteromonas sp. BSi20439]